METNLIDLLMDIIKWLLGLKNGNGIKTNSNKNYDLSKMKAVTRKQSGAKYSLKYCERYKTQIPFQINLI